MSGGLSFGALPSFADLSPDQQAMIMQALQQPAPAPQVPGGLLSQDPSSPQPSARGLGDLLQGGPPVAMSEADTQRLERQQASPADLAALGGSPVDRLLFDRAGMGGGPGGFSGSSGAPLDPSATGSVPGPGARPTPLPPMRPSDADLMMPPAPMGSAPVSGMNPGVNGAPQRQLVSSSSYHPDLASDMPPGGRPPAAADPNASAAPASAPNVGQFDPLTGQVVSGSPRALGVPQAPVSPTGAATATGQASGQGGASLLEKFANGLNNPQVGNLLLNVGMGLMSQRGFGPGIVAGLQGYQNSNLNNVKQQLEQFKLMQAVQGQQAQRNYLIKNKGLSPDAADALIANPTLLSNQLAQEKPNYQTVGGQIYDLNRNGGVPGQGNLIGPASGPPSGYQSDPNNPQALTYQQGGPEDPAVKERNARAVATDKEQTPLTDPDARAAAGIPSYDARPAWKDPNGKVTFDNGPTPKITTTRNPDGSSTAREYDPATRSFREIPGGGGPALDTTGVPPGVDPLTYRREAAKAAVSEQKTASQRSQQATAAMPILDRAERAYSALAQNGGIGPYASSTFNRTVSGAMGKQNEIDRQEYEAAAKELELQKAQISMKGQGAVTDSERRLLSMTLPRLDAASPETGLSTLRGMRTQFNKAMSAEGLPSSGQQGAGQGQQQPSSQQQGSAASRYQQLRQGGMSQSDAYARLHQEGY